MLAESDKEKSAMQEAAAERPELGQGVNPQDYFKGQKNKDIEHIGERIHDDLTRDMLSSEEFPILSKVRLSEEQADNLAQAVRLCLEDKETEKGQLMCVILGAGEDTLVDGGIDPSNETLEQLSEDLAKWLGEQRLAVNDDARGELFTR